MKSKKKLLILISLIGLLLIIGIVIVVLINSKNTNVSSLITTKNECLKKDSICENGTLLNIKINDNETNNFYVINDDGKKMTLIMDKNIVENISWSSNNTGCSHGPENLINNLKQLTNNWVNIQEKDYPIVDSNKCYEKIIERMKARIPSLEELSTLGCQHFYENTCPEYLVSNLESSSGYWLSTSNEPLDSNGAYVVYKDRNLFTPWVITNDNYGLRLVIEVEK